MAVAAADAGERLAERAWRAGAPASSARKRTPPVRHSAAHVYLPSRHRGYRPDCDLRRPFGAQCSRRLDGAPARHARPARRWRAGSSVQARRAWRRPSDLRTFRPAL